MSPSIPPDAPSPSPDGPTEGGSRDGGRVWLAVALAAVVLIPRSVAIAVAHSETYDDGYHLSRGLDFLTGAMAAKVAGGAQTYGLNDPPLGEGLLALPILVANLLAGRPAGQLDLYGHPYGRDALVAAIAAWKALLFLPAVAVAFLWAGRLYGPRPAWLAAALLLVEPTFAAHLPVVALDSFGVEGILLSCYLAWRLVERPTIGRGVALGAMIAVAMNLKHVAIILPAVVAAMAGVGWVLRPWATGQRWADWRAALPARLRATAAAAVATVAFFWPATLFDVSTPPWSGTRDSAATASHRQARNAVKAALRRPWPAGVYFYSFISAVNHSRAGHFGYLMGESRQGSWWYYYPVVAAYKVPLGIVLVVLLALASVRAVPPRWDEAYPLLAWAAWTLLLVTSKINIGFRHYLPPYAFLLILASRCVADRDRVRTALAWAGVVAAGLHAAASHPDYLSYINFPRDRPYLAISDSNIDWGQSLKEVGRWLDAHPHPGRPAYLGYFGEEIGGIGADLGGRVAVLDVVRGERPGRPGLLVISPVLVTGQYPYIGGGAYRALAEIRPDAIIGHAMLVYDLSRPELAPFLKAPPPDDGEGRR